MRTIKARQAARKEKDAQAKSPRANTPKNAPLWMRVFSTVSMLGILSLAVMGAWFGFHAGGLGAGFAGLIGGGALGWFISFVIGNMLKEMLPLIRVLLVLGIIGATIYVLHLLGVQLGINPQ
jgi:predicted lipid-binding transport protein (Tim44 family)